MVVGLPVGTEVVLSLFRVDEPVYEPVTNEYAGREPGSTIYSPAPQGLFVPLDDKMVNVLATEGSTSPWLGLDTVAGLRAALLAGKVIDGATG